MSQTPAPAALVYTQELPTVSGFYWVLFSFDYSPMMEHLSVEDGLVHSLDQNYDRHDYELADGNWFAGPIPEPTLPEGFVAQPLAASACVDE
ncbi:hypothetical protein [Pseudomonas sp. CFBP 13719]|uniref:hypothetical protein n=1 Tax=Pseudomonas sp. CFBP 13719 TaxID=2775303 RepID=UPI00177E4ECD|nr:hypothetical protein [Pseudomonas sp. CFBP 13719]